MAIRFVDKDAGEARTASAKPAPPRAPAPTEVPIAESPADEAEPLPGLPHAKPEPKPRGRKKPLSAAAPDKQSDAAPLLDGLLPELQAHAKPTPKPRGRKKAFG